MKRELLVIEKGHTIQGETLDFKTVVHFLCVDYNKLPYTSTKESCYIGVRSGIEPVECGEVVGLKREL